MTMIKGWDFVIAMMNFLIINCDDELIKTLWPLHAAAAARGSIRISSTASLKPLVTNAPRTPSSDGSQRHAFLPTRFR